MVGTSEVEAARSELLQLKQTAQEVQAEYRQYADQRVSQQQTLARLVQTVQSSSASKNDVPLVEDVIIVSLRAETKASRSQAELLDGVEPPPKIDPANQPSGSVSSAEEALAIYNGQIKTLHTDLNYRNAMRDAEKALTEIYGEGIQQIMEVVEEYCSDDELTSEMQGIAASA